MDLARLLFRLLLGPRLPRLSGQLAVPGSAALVRIARDGHGAPCITVESEDDVWFGLGFFQGQDRAFQLELLLRTVHGTLATLFGAEPSAWAVVSAGFAARGLRGI